MSVEVDADIAPAHDSGTNRQVTEMVITYLDAKGVAERSRATVVAKATGLTVQHARRRLGPDGPPWVVSELGKITQYFGDKLASLLPLLSACSDVDVEPCEIELAGHWYGAMAEVGEIARGCKAGELVAFRHNHRWRLVPLEQVPSGVDGHKVTRITVLPKPSQNIRVAILDDDASVANSLRDALSEGGLSATAFGLEERLAERLMQFDVFVIDFILGSSTTASAIVEKVRSAKPSALIVLLTGHAREDASSEIANLVRAHALHVLEKPAQIMILESLIDAHMQERSVSPTQ
ncbi:MAG: hypothetical protein EKK45_01180 [Curvibacter sp.]|jgi:ActR/RegA family two-component response regulator|nr:MAG: hypothetical protein EKK45_01180 [Curvibacter sp.]